MHYIVNIFKMYKKIVVILAIAFVVSASQISDQENVGDKVDDLLKKLQEVVDATVAKARQELMVAEGGINKTAAAVEAEAATALKGLQNSFKSELDALKEKAKKANVNIDSCLGKDEETLTNLPTATSNDIVQCVQGLLIQVINYVNDALTKIQKTADDVAQIKQDIKNCGKGWKAVTCLAKLASKIEGEIVSLPKDITNDVNGVINIIENIEPKIKQCGSDGIDHCESKGKALLTKIGVCVAGKIIH